MNRIKQGNRYVLDTIRNHLTLEEFSEFINSIKKNPLDFIRDLTERSILIRNPRLIEEVDQKNDFCNLKIIDFLNYYFTKEENPTEKLIETYKVLTKNILPAGFITGKFKSISFEQIPEHPIARINFSEKRNVTIKAVNNIIELGI